MEDTCIGFIGFGLIGGSIARALKSKNQAAKLIAYNYHIGKPNASLELAKSDGVLDRIVTSFDNGFENCDIIFLCAPVLDNIKYLSQLKAILKPSCILTDVGSVKGNIHKAVSNLGLEDHFIGGHPMAGTEKTGYEHSMTTLLENAYYVLTPTKLTTEAALSKLISIVSLTGAIPVILDPDYHDDIVSAISHVPHIISASLVNMVKDHDDKNETMRLLAAGGFKDITRISSSSPIMWQNICLTNKDSILRFLHYYIEKLTYIQTYIEDQDHDKLLGFFEEAKSYRDQIPTKSVGLIQKVHELYLDLMDEEGAIATVATILATNHISIKNIGIIHNREFEDGVLRLELYTEEGAIKAAKCLRNYNYTIYER
ncbi:MAG: prephenate dehydrogenase [bacterium]|nr:prephenate dehydrogenase [bacterium]